MMRNYEKIVCLEMGAIAKKRLIFLNIITGPFLRVGRCGDAFINFLRYCSERLNRGDSVQVIWRDFQEKAQ